jgi:hypothetical protein
VVPHHAGDIEQGAVQDPATEIGPGRPADAVDRVAAEAPLAGEEPAPLQRIAREDGGETLVTRGRRADGECRSHAREKGDEADDQDPPLHDLPPVVGRSPSGGAAGCAAGSLPRPGSARSPQKTYRTTPSRVRKTGIATSEIPMEADGTSWSRQAVRIKWLIQTMIPTMKRTAAPAIVH